MLILMRVSINRVANFLTFIAAGCLILMMLQTVIDVILRYFFNSPVPGNLEVVSFYYMVGVVFLPFAMVELRHEHIVADLFVRMLPQKGQTAMYVLGNIVSIIFLVAFGYQTLLDAIDSTQKNEVMMGSIFVTIWPSRWALPAGFFLCGFAVLFNAIEAVLCPHTFDPSPTPSELADEEDLYS